jgi:hypothetical protein
MSGPNRGRPAAADPAWAPEGDHIPIIKTRAALAAIPILNPLIAFISFLLPWFH